MADLSSQIETNSNKPRSATVDGNSVTKHSLAEQIEADAYLKANAAAESTKRGFVQQRFKPPGST